MILLLLDILSIMLVLFTSTDKIAADFSCPRANGTYINSADYRSYYECSNYCPRLIYCLSSQSYFSRTNQVCAVEPTDWTPNFDLTGQFKFDEITDIFVRQEGYNVFITYNTPTTRYFLRARYINQTHAMGIQTAHRRINNCIIVFNVRIVATGNKAYCYGENLYPLSTLCDLPNNYSGNYCKVY